MYFRGMPKAGVFSIPNLLSLSRVFLTPVIGYFLWRGDDRATVIALVLIILAAVTDGLDGYLARKLGQISDLGIALDPVADKIFAGVLVILLVLFRDFPLWLAAVIVGRDLLIMVGGGLIIRQRKVTVPSNLTGKYAFAVIAVLLASHVIRFEFGIVFMTYLTVLFVFLSVLSYFRIFVVMAGGRPVPVFRDKAVYKAGRIVLAFAVTAVFLYRLYGFVFPP